MEKKYNVGDIVFTKNTSALKSLDFEVFNEYFRKDLLNPSRAPLILFEKELVPEGRLLTPQRAEPLPVTFKEGGTLMNIWTRIRIK